ncbi:hypothetical protein ACHWQZ_G001732 [Mnemiopsis leidyi]
MATSDEELTVWVGGLDPQVTTEILWELFVQAGPLLDIKLPVDRETGEQRPFAFIAFKHPISGPYAERLFNGIQLFDKTIRVRYKGSQRFDQNKYHELYEKLLERLVVENPDKYAGVFEEIDELKTSYVGNRIVYDEDEQFAGYNASRTESYHGNSRDSFHGNQRHQEQGGYGDQRRQHYHDRSHHDRSHHDRSHHDRSYNDQRHKPYNRSRHEEQFYRQRGSRF